MLCVPINYCEIPLKHILTLVTQLCKRALIMKPQSILPVFIYLFPHIFCGIVAPSCGRRPVAILIMFSSSVTSHAPAIEHLPQNR